jgi:hypothetical protein
MIAVLMEDSLVTKTLENSLVVMMGTDVFLLVTRQGLFMSVLYLITVAWAKQETTVPVPTATRVVQVFVVRRVSVLAKLSTPLVQMAASVTPGLALEASVTISNVILRVPRNCA